MLSTEYHNMKLPKTMLYVDSLYILDYRDLDITSDYASHSCYAEVYCSRTSSRDRAEQGESLMQAVDHFSVPSFRTQKVTVTTHAIITMLMKPKPNITSETTATDVRD